MKKFMLVSPVIFIALSAIWVVQFSFAQEKIPLKFEEINMDYCSGLGFLINTPQYERAQGKPYLEPEWVIDSDSQYTDLQNKINKECPNIHLPAIDFSQKTLLGKWAEGSCASRGFKRVVLRDDAKKEIVYSVQPIEERMACSGPGLESMGLIAIPKKSNDYKVVFLPHFDTSGYQSFFCENGKTMARDWNGKTVEVKNTPPPGGGIFGVELDCGGDMLEKLPLDAKKLMVESGGENVPPPCPEGTKVEGSYCKKL
jgi:hypothetical protein